MHRKYLSYRLAIFVFLFWSIQFISLAQEKDIPVFEVQNIPKLVNAEPESIHIFSFWATWCAPCLKEINLIKSVEVTCNCNLKPYFINMEEEIRRSKALKMAKKKDFEDQLYFTKNVTTDFHKEVDTTWAGTFPAMLLIDGKTQKRWFFNQLVSRKKLTALIDSLRSR